MIKHPVTVPKKQRLLKYRDTEINFDGAFVRVSRYALVDRPKNDDEYLREDFLLEYESLFLKSAICVIT